MHSTIKKAISVLAIIALMISSMFAVPSEVKADETGTNYYVDSIKGSDSNAGTSQSAPWKTLDKVNSKTAFEPGDKILLKAGSIWTGMLNPKGSGVEGSPITIDRYGSGNKPVINGGGMEFPKAPLRLGNQSYWEISNLEITNNDFEEGYRAAVLVRSNNKQVNRHLYFSNMNIHDVKGDNHFGAGKSTGGIIIDAMESIGTRYDDILIEENTFTTVDRTGINFGWIAEEYSGATGSDGYHTNIVIRNNTLSDIGGDGIMVMFSKSPLVEYNVSQSGNMRASLKSPADGYSVAMWPWSTDDAVFQFNEVYGEKWNEAQYQVYGGFGEDGSAFDVDGFNFRSIHQYNYSHDNQGGFIMVCGNADVYSDNSIIRYNISQNDGDDLFDINGPNKNTYIYNNVFYTKEGMNVKPYNFRGNGGYSDNTQSYNNIFYNMGTGDNVWGGATNIVFDYNVFYGNHSSTEPMDPHKITADPMLVNPGSGTFGLDSLAGYKLLEGSPLIDAGMPIGILGEKDNGGKDFWGNGLYNGAPDIGVHEFISNNLIVNPGFESGNTTGWSESEGTTAVVGGEFAHSGNHAIEVGANSSITQSVVNSVYGDHEFTLSAWAKAEQGASGYIGVKALDSSNIQIETDLIVIPVTNPNYERVEEFFTTPAGTEKLEIYFSSVFGSVYADDFSLEKGDATKSVPAAPSGLTAIADGKSQININWPAVSGAIGYDLMVDGVVISGVSSPYAHTGLSVGSSHSYKVRSKNNAGESAWSPVVNTATIAAASNVVQNPGFESSTLDGWGIWEGSPTIVSDTQVTKVSHNGTNALYLENGASVYQNVQANVAAEKNYTFSFWAKNSVDEAYIGVSYLDSNGTGITAPSVDFTVDKSDDYKQYTGTFRTPEGVETLQIYVVAGTEMYVDEFSLERSPAVPSGLTTTIVGTSQIDLVWAAVEDATGYDLLVDDRLVVDVKSPYSHTGLEDGATHAYQIRSKHSGDTSAWTPAVNASLIEQANILINPGFEAGTAGWAVGWGAEIVAGIGNNGTYGIRGDGWDGRSQVVTKGVEGDKIYLVSAWGKVSAIEEGKPDAGQPGLGTIDVSFYDSNNVLLKGTASPIKVTSSEMQHYTGSFITPPTAVKMELAFQANDMGVFIVDDIVLESSIPSGLRKSEASENQISVSWNAVTGASQYDLFVDGALVSNVTSPYVHKELIEGSTHTYSVRARRSDTGTSPWSAPITVSAQKLQINLLSNPGFEKGDLSGWDQTKPGSEIYGIVNVVKEEVHSGTFALKADTASGFNRSGITGFKENETYSLLVWAKSTGSADGYIGINFINSAGEKLEDAAVELSVTNTDYEQLGGRFVIPAGTASLELYLSVTGSGSIYVDDFMLTKTQPSFTINAAALDRTSSIKAVVNIKPTLGGLDHSGNEVIIFELLDGDVPVGIIALHDDIKSAKELTAEFHVPDPSKASYKVKVLVFDKFGNSSSAAENLAAPKIMV